MTGRSVVAVLVILGSVGCSGDDEMSEPTGADPMSTATATPAVTTVVPEPVVATVPPGSGGESLGPLGSTQIRIETDEGTVQIGSGDVPVGLGPDFPLPPDLVVELASETAADLGFSGVSRLPFDDLVEIFRDGLPEAGFTVEQIETPADDVAVIDFSDDEGAGQVAISGSATTSGGFTVIVAYGVDTPN